MKSMRKEVQIEPFGGGMLPLGTGGFDPRVPVTGLGLEEMGVTKILGGWPLVGATFADGLEGVLSDRFICVEGWWTLDPSDVMMERIRATAERAITAIASMPKKRRR